MARLPTSGLPITGGAGARPTELPVAQTAAFTLAISPKIANAFGLTVPTVVRARADETIEWDGICCGASVSSWRTAIIGVAAAAASGIWQLIRRAVQSPQSASQSGNVYASIGFFENGTCRLKIRFGAVVAFCSMQAAKCFNLSTAGKTHASGCRRLLAD